MVRSTLSVTEAAVVATTLAFVATTVFVFGVSITVGTNCFLFFSTEDYLRLAVLWITPVAIFIGLGVAVNVVGEAVASPEKTEWYLEVLNSTSSDAVKDVHNPLMKRIGMITWVLTNPLLPGPWLLLAFGGIVWSGEPWYFWPLIFLGLWNVLVLRLVRKRGIRLTLTRSLAWLLGPCLIVIALFRGIDYADDVINQSPTAIIHLDTGDPSEARILFSLADYLVVLAESDRLFALSAERVKKVEVTTSKPEPP